MTPRDRAAGAPGIEERPAPVRRGDGFRGRVAVVTGGATGLGRSVCLEFAQRGAGVAFNYLEMPGRDVAAQALLTETALKAHGIPVYCAHCDIRDGSSVTHF